MLNRNKSIKILPVDKMNTTVFNDRTEYNKKIEDVIKKGNYQVLHKDATIAMKRNNSLNQHQDHFDNRQ